MVPGLVIAQHAGGGKAEQIFLRGFDADHGTDVAVSVDGTPVNMVSHAHGQGYADLHFLIPEVVSEVEVRKGPYDVRDGDFATAGAVAFRTLDRLDIPRPVVEARGGSFGTARSLLLLPLGGGAERAGGYVAATGHVSNGPVELPQRYRRGNLFARWTVPLGRDVGLVATASGFGARWNASGQIPERAVAGGLISRFGAVDPSEGGRTDREEVSVELRSRTGGAASWDARLFVAHYGLTLFSNFTFFLTDSVNGDGIGQRDDRVFAGLRAAYQRAHDMFGRPGAMDVGVGTRLDQADVSLFRQSQRAFLGSRVDARVGQALLFAWAREAVTLSARVRLEVGLRGDLFRFGVRDRLLGVDSTLPRGSGTRWNGLVSPKASIAVDVGAGTRLYANAAGGFHSNDARDVVLAGASDRVLPRAWGAELGARRTWRTGSVAAALWGLTLQSQLLWVGDEGVTEASGRSRRLGLDLEGRLRLLPWLWADADLNLARSRFVDEPSGADRVPLAPTLTATGGLTARGAGPLSGAIRLRHVARRPADETGAVMARGSTQVEAFGSWHASRFDVQVAVDNLFDVAWNEAQFATTSRLRGEPAAVTDLHFTPGAPRTIQVSVAYAF